MTKYTLKRKLYADDNQGDGMGMGTKLLLGAGTLAAGFGAAKAGTNYYKIAASDTKKSATLLILTS